MANASYITSLWSGTKTEIKRAAQYTFEYLLRNIKIGPIGDQEAAGNMGGTWYEVTTSSVANQEFSFQHRLGNIPSLIMVGAIPANVSGAQVVPVTLSTLADANRVYLKSATTGAVIYVYVESAGA